MAPTKWHDGDDLVTLCLRPTRSQRERRGTAPTLFGVACAFILENDFHLQAEEWKHFDHLCTRNLIDCFIVSPFRLALLLRSPADVCSGCRCCCSRACLASKVRQPSRSADLSRRRAPAYIASRLQLRILPNQAENRLPAASRAAKCDDEGICDGQKINFLSVILYARDKCNFIKLIQFSEWKICARALCLESGRQRLRKTRSIFASLLHHSRRGKLSSKEGNWRSAH